MKAIVGIDENYYDSLPAPIIPQEKVELDAFRKKLEKELDGWWTTFKKTGNIS